MWGEDLFHDTAFLLGQNDYLWAEKCTPGVDLEEGCRKCHSLPPPLCQDGVFFFVVSFKICSPY